MHLKKQILRLYLLEIFGSFSLTDGIWIIFLIQRGFSLVEVGLAETVFHIASFLFEIPSGAIADLFGRKKAMIASYPVHDPVRCADRCRLEPALFVPGHDFYRSEL